eukprot:564762-Prymnesium_polylepis.1
MVLISLGLKVTRLAGSSNRCDASILPFSHNHSTSVNSDDLSSDVPPMAARSRLSAEKAAETNT